MEAKQIEMFGTLHRLLDSTNGKVEALEASLQVLQKRLDKLEKETSVAAASTAEGRASDRCPSLVFRGWNNRHGPTHLEDAEIAPAEAAEGVCDVKLVDSCAKASGVKVEKNHMNPMIQCLRTQLKEVRDGTCGRYHPKTSWKLAPAYERCGVARQGQAKCVRLTVQWSGSKP